MAIEVHCDCGNVYNVGGELSGKKIRCKKCAVVLKVPVIPMEQSGEPAPPSNEWEPISEDGENATPICQTCGTPGKKGDAVCLACGAALADAPPGLLEKVPRKVLLGVLGAIAVAVVGTLGYKLVSSSHLSGLLASGNDKLNRGDVKGARADFDAVLKESKDSLPALDGLVRCGVKGSEWNIVKKFGPVLSAKLPKGPQRARVRLDLARAQFETSDWTSAEKSAHSAQEDDESIEGADELVALALLGAKDAKAEEALKKADSAGSKDPRIQLGLAKLAEDKGAIKDARAWADKAAANATQDEAGAAVWISCGHYREKDGDVNGALNALKSACEANPKSGEAWTRLVLAYLEQKKFQDALAAASKAKDLAPDDGLAARALGEVLLETNDLEKAKVELERAEKLLPEDAIATFLYGKALLRAGDKDGGVRRIEVAVKKLDKDPQWAIEGGRAILENGGAAEKALNMLDVCVKSEPKELTPALTTKFADARILLARAAARTDRSRNVRLIEERLRQAIDMDPSRKDAYLDLGTHYAEVDNHKGAQDVLEKGLKLYPEDQDMLYGAGVEALRAKSSKAAVEHLEKLNQKNPGYKDVKKKLDEARSALQFEGG
jgi:tetratricopeptide (TPR) repeat protein